MQDMHIGEVLEIELPYSEVLMFMRVAGTAMHVECLANGAQLRDADGNAFSFPVTHGEAGIQVVPNVGDMVTIDHEDNAVITGMDEDHKGSRVFIVETEHGDTFTDVPARRLDVIR